jgi:hypothetical protein
VPDEVFAEIERAAAGERRTPSNWLRNLLADAMARRAGRLPPALQRFVKEIAVELGQEAGDAFRVALTALDLEADGNNSAGMFLMAAEWIACRRDKPVQARIDAIDRLRQLKGHHIVNLRQFTGWA